MCFRLLIKNGNNIDSPPVYDSYEVEYLPNEGVLSTGRYLFVEFTTDGTLTSTGAAIRYEGRFILHSLLTKQQENCTSAIVFWYPAYLLYPQRLPKGCAMSRLWSTAISAAATPPTVWVQWLNSHVTLATRWSKALWWLSVWMRKTLNGMRPSQPAGVSHFIKSFSKNVLPPEKNFESDMTDLMTQGFHFVLDHCRSPFFFFSSSEYKN